MNNLSSKLRLSLFYSLYSVTFYTVVGNLFSTLIEQTIGYYSFFEFIVMIIPALLNFFVMKFFKVNFQFLRSNYSQLKPSFLAVINLITFIVCTIQVGSYIWETKIGNLGNLRYLITIIFIITILALIYYLNLKLNHLQKRQVELLKEQQLEQISLYAHQIESLYYDIRNIRHDFVNIIKSLDQSIKDNDMDGVRNIYDSVLEQVGDSLQSNKFDLMRLSNVKIDAVKSLLAAKIIEAQQKEIQIHTEILTPFSNLYIDLLDYIRILSIFIDNAIEANEEISGNKEIEIAIIVNEQMNNHYLIVENNYPVGKSIDIDKIYESGYSTKGLERGLGLPIVKELIAKYPNLTLETEAKDGRFKQQIIFTERIH